MTEIIDKIEIPADDDGYVLFKCPLCGEFFKVLVSDYTSDDVIEINCPSCGMKSDDYFTEDVILLAGEKGINYMNRVIEKEMKKLERSLRGSPIKMRITRRIPNREENPIKYGIENLDIFEYLCCNKSAKIKPMYIYCGSYCPYCGVFNG